MQLISNICITTFASLRQHFLLSVLNSFDNVLSALLFCFRISQIVDQWQNVVNDRTILMSTKYVNKEPYHKKIKFSAACFIRVTKYEVPSADSAGESANHLLLKYLHPKIKDIHL